MKFISGIFLSLCVFVMNSAPSAQEVKLGDLVLSDPYVRAMPATAKVTSGYLNIHNHGSSPDQLLAATSSVAARIEIHEMQVENDVMRMRPLRQGLELPAGQTLSLTSGGYHLMIFEPRALIRGNTFPIELHFASAGKIEVDFKIMNIEDKKADGEHHHHHAH